MGKQCLLARDFPGGGEAAAAGQRSTPVRLGAFLAPRDRWRADVAFEGSVEGGFRFVPDTIIEEMSRML